VLVTARYILVGASPSKTPSADRGGVLTLSTALINYATKNGYSIDVINTLRSGFDSISLLSRLKAGWNRTVSLKRALKAGSCGGVIIFSGAGFSFYERIILSGVCRWFNVNSLLVIVDGWFLQERDASILKRRWIGLLLRIPSKLLASGARWSDLFRELGVKSSRIAKIHYWLPQSFSISKMEKRTVAGKDLHFIFVGWMIKEKGVGEILAAISELKKDFRFSFTFVGGGTLLEVVRQEIHDSGWTGSVSALGWVGDDEFQKLLSSADIFVLPSYAEGFPMSLIEALSKGLPAICSDVGGISDSLRDGMNGYLIAPRQVPPLVKAMKHYLTNRHLIEDHSKSALEIVKANHEAETNCKLVFEALM
jgi:glycosyltransferase involved in cell wall biosynthesis